MEKIKVASFNMHHGKENLVPYTHQAMVASIAKIDADIIVLQEADVFSLRTRFVHQPRLISKKLKLYCASTLMRFFGLGFQHLAVVSRFKIVDTEKIDLPRKPGTQKRIAFIVRIQLPDRVLSIATTHLHAIKNIRNHNELGIEQLDYLLKYCRENNIDILAGDLNLLDEIVLEKAEEYGYKSESGFATSPANNPRYQIDWILSRESNLEGFEVSTMLASDHRAISAYIEL